MKKKIVLDFLFRTVLVAMVAVSFVACSDDDPEVSQEGDPDIEVENEPTADVVTTHIDRTAYLVDGLFATSSERAMIGNFLARYNRTVPFSDLKTVVAGDAVAFEATSLNGLLSDDAKASVIKSAYNQGAVLLMSGGQSSDFARLCGALGCYNPYEDAANEALADGEKPLWVLSGELPSANGIYAMLSPYIPADEEVTITTIEDGEEVDDDDLEAPNFTVAEPGFMSDYRKGQLCEQVAIGINKGLAPKSASNVDQKELTDLMSATKLYLSGTRSWQKDSKSQKRTASFCIELDIWNAYSESEKEQYYLVHQEMTYAFGEYCIGSFHNGAWKEYGRYGKYYETTFRNTDKPEAVKFHRLSPYTTQMSTTYTSAVALNLGGNVSLKDAGVTAGLNISHSETYTVEDVYVTNNSVASSQLSKASWTFDMRDASGYYNWKAHGFTDFKPCSASARSTFVCGTDYILSVPQGTPNKWELESVLTTRLVSCYSAFGKVKTKYYDNAKTKTISFVMPEVPVK